MKFQIFDEDGIIALADPAAYASFVDKDWTLEQLLRHFRQQMNHQTIIVWQANANGGGNWTVSVVHEPSPQKALREFVKTIRVTNGQLCFTPYTDLTMAAQFDDEAIPGRNNQNLCFAVANGTWRVQVRQLVDTDMVYTDDPSIVHFEIVLAPVAENAVTSTEGVYWWK
jgi:hypothetical protein